MRVETRILGWVLVPAIVGMCAWPAQAKLAVVDTAKVVKEYEKTKDAKVRLEKDIEDKNAELKKMSEGLAKMKKDFETQSGVLSQSKKDALQKKIEAQEDVFRDKYKENQELIMSQQKTLMEGIVNDVKKIVENIAKDKGYELVVDKESVLYYKGDDITYKVLDQLNK